MKSNTKSYEYVTPHRPEKTEASSYPRSSPKKALDRREPEVHPQAHFPKQEHQHPFSCMATHDLPSMASNDSVHCDLD